MHLLFHKELYPAIPPACSSCCQVSKSWNKTPSHCRLNCIYSLSRHKERCQALKTHLWADTQKLTTPTKDSEYRGGNSQSQSIMAIVYCLSSERTARVQSTLIVLIGELKVYCNFNPGNVKDQIFLWDNLHYSAVYLLCLCSKELAKVLLSRTLVCGRIWFSSADQAA